MSFNPTSGLLSGTPTLAGSFNVMLTASNAVGLSASALAVTIFDTGSTVVREVWTNAPGVNVSDIPLTTPVSSTATLGTLEGITDFGDNYGERIRGYLTAPVTGNYYFWIAGSDSAELWISNDSEPVNKVRRAYVLPAANPSPPPQMALLRVSGTCNRPRRSGWLSLVAGQRYYIEILHKAGTGAGDNWAVGWLQDSDRHEHCSQRRCARLRALPLLRRLRLRSRLERSTSPTCFPPAESPTCRSARPPCG